MSKLKTIIILFSSLIVFTPIFVSAQEIWVDRQIIYQKQGEIKISDTGHFQAFYDDLKGSPRIYLVSSIEDFDLYFNILVPESSNAEGRYSARIFLIKDGEKQVSESDGGSFKWQELYNEPDRDYYLKGPEFSQKLPGGEYKIEIYSRDNNGKYVLTIGNKEKNDIKYILNSVWQLPILKNSFNKTEIWQFFLTPYGIGVVAVIGGFLILLSIIYYFIGLTRQIIKHNRAKTILLTSAGMRMKNEIMHLLQKPAYDITVAFISTAAKPQENLEYVKRDWDIMREEMGFNVEEVDIEGKTESEVMRIIGIKDIVFVEGGNTFYLLNAMRKCNFERIIKKLLKQGKVYIGASAGSIVAGKTINTAGWKDMDKNIVNLKNLRGLNIVPFDIFVHYRPEHAETIIKKIPWAWLRRRRLKIITDEQAILVQGKEINLIGQGDAIIL